MIRFLLLYKIEVTNQYPVAMLAVGVVTVMGLTALSKVLS